MGTGELPTVLTSMVQGIIPTNTVPKASPCTPKGTHLVIPVLYSIGYYKLVSSSGVVGRWDTGILG